MHHVSSPPVRQVLWGRELMEPGKMPTADYARVMEDDTALLDWLENLDRCVVVKMMMMIDRDDGYAAAAAADDDMMEGSGLSS